MVKTRNFLQYLSVAHYNANISHDLIGLMNYDFYNKIKRSMLYFGYFIAILILVFFGFILVIEM